MRAARTDVRSGQHTSASMVPPPGPGQQRAYRREVQGGALHVYAASYERRQHLARLPAQVFTGRTIRLIADIEAGLGWLERAA